MGKCEAPCAAQRVRTIFTSTPLGFRLIGQLFVVGSLLWTHQANAGLHYVELPAYTTQVAEYSPEHAPPPQQQVIIESQTSHSSSSYFLLNRPTLCRIDFFNTLLCGSFLEGNSHRVKISETIASKQELIHLIDLAYLDQITVSTDENRMDDLEGLLNLAISPHFQKLRPNPNLGSSESLLQSKLVHSPIMSGRSEERPEFSQLILEKVFLWLETEEFHPSFEDIYFLSMLFGKLYAPDTLGRFTPQEAVWIQSKKEMLLRKIQSLSAREDLTTEERDLLIKEIDEQINQERLKQQLHKRLQIVPKKVFASSRLFRLLGDDD